MNKSSRLAFFLSLGILLGGCLTAPEKETITLSKGVPDEVPKHLFIFLDGTRNDQKSRTNVWELHSLIQKTATSAEPTEIIYIEGVGSAENPVLGMALGFGMESRILRAYQFLMERYRPNDQVYIFGFSRGAHQARALAGMLAYSGLPIDARTKLTDSLRTANKILEVTKEKNDVDYASHWSNSATQKIPPLVKEIAQRLELKIGYAPVAFLGLWDTVPGSSFKEYSSCKELLDSRSGDRYKTDSYPNIKRIAHAVSVDEKRSMFSPLFVCSPIDPKFTTVTEVWFPGAHADIGGGYEDSNELAKISFRWMVEQLAPIYPIRSEIFPENGNPLALSHWSVGDFPANFRSSCVDRTPPANAIFHSSVKERRESGLVSIRINGKEEKKAYPVACQ